jgi:hypothetical protein
MVSAISPVNGHFVTLLGGTPVITVLCVSKN